VCVLALRDMRRYGCGGLGSKTTFERSVVCDAAAALSKVSGESLRIVRVGRFGPVIKSKSIYCRLVMIENAARLVCGGVPERCCQGCDGAEGDLQQFGYTAKVARTAQTPGAEFWGGRVNWYKERTVTDVDLPRVGKPPDPI
jgi:hypothetical protein